MQTNTLRLIKYKIVLRFTSASELPPFLGNTIRGALGGALERMGSPAYEQVFKVKTPESVPNPYAIDVPYPSKSIYKAGDTLEFYITLFGCACEYAAEFTVAANDMSRGNLKNCVLDDFVAVYDRIWSDAGSESIPQCNEILIKFATPTEILSSKKTMSELSFGIFVDSLFGRIGGIIDNYMVRNFIIPYALVSKKPFVSATHNIKQLTLKTRNQPINGFIGTIKYSGNITPYLPYIDLGSQIHIGKKTTRACGEYSFEI